MSYANGFGKKSSNIEYLCRPRLVGGDPVSGEFFVVKLANEEKLEEYRVTLDPNSCECMAWISKRRRPCKHQLLISRWLKEGQPIRTYPNKEVVS